MAKVKLTKMNTPPQWLSASGRPNTKHPEYKYNADAEYRDYRAWNEENKKAGRMVERPKDMAESVKQKREADTSPSAMRSKEIQASAADQLSERVANAKKKYLARK